VAALEHLERAIALEPDYALALAYASWSLARRVTVSLQALSPEEAARGLELARAALRYGEDDPVVLAICGHSLLAAGMRAEGVATVRRGLKANPNNVIVLALGGICNVLAGDLDEGEACCRRAYQLSPGDPHSFEMLSSIGFARFFKGDYIGALEWLDLSRATLVDWPPAYWMFAASYAHLDRFDEAQRALHRLQELAPHTSIASLENIGVRSDERFVRLLDGLRKAGLN
jgi:tetratricopeptide (TPR) repeat protein